LIVITFYQEKLMIFLKICTVLKKTLSLKENEGIIESFIIQNFPSKYKFDTKYFRSITGLDLVKQKKIKQKILHCGGAMRGLMVFNRRPNCLHPCAEGAKTVTPTPFISSMHLIPT